MTTPAQPAAAGGLQKATIINTDVSPTQTLIVQFNPSQYSINRENTFAEAAIPGRSNPLLQFSHGNLRTLEMELFFDTYEKRGDVRVVTDQLLHLLDINPDTHAPPVLLFVWGSLSFQCVLARAAQRYVLFLPDGRPARARIQATFHFFNNGLFEAKETKKSTADFTKVHVVRQGETLSAISARVYANPALWRPLAIRNGIDDPHVLPAGLRLAVPRLPYRDPESGEVFQ